jgi:SAM-dependent methyltransferase
LKAAILALSLEVPMAELPPIRFRDGAAYERMMGRWSHLAGSIFLDWLAPQPGMNWLDVGCGNGAFTELIVARHAPSAVQGIDPSETQLAFARERHTAEIAEFRSGNAMALPYADNSFDSAVMALVIFFVPQPEKGVAEMARVTRPGGSVAAYAWDVVGGGLPFEPIHAEMRAMGMSPARPPSFQASQLEQLRALWRAAGLVDIETRTISVTRTFEDFEDYWTTNLLGASLSDAIASMPPADVERLKRGTRSRVTAEADGRIVHRAHANAVKGRVPT